PAKGRIRFVFPAGQYHSFELIYDQRTYLIQRMIFFFAAPIQSTEDGPLEKARLEIRYEKLRKNPTDQALYFRSQRYFQKLSPSAVLQPAYADYQLANYYTATR
ncbi:MAG: hypothetical protein AAF206_20700, partial [Bacteroidota bacterium]